MIVALAAVAAVAALASPRVDAAERIAAAHWHGQPCTPLAVVKRTLPRPYLAVAQPWRCRIVLNRRRLHDLRDWNRFCTVMVHEEGHLKGLGHSRDPRNVMYPRYVRPLPACIRHKVVL